jgi:23S rRNA (cytidine1920-2'-O)/16S rRNA (cytidine1409-2'-O)-methyltransferase
VTKAAAEVSTSAVLDAEPAHPYVSRGGVKLAAALDHFGFNPAGRVCLDVGASTGGFSEVQLARGARCIYAVDVGRGQLHPRLRARPEILSMEGTDIRNLPAARFAEPPEFITIDVSFISLRLVLPAVAALAASPAWLVALIKPQFEAGPMRARKGVVRDPGVQAAACAEVQSLLQALGWQVEGIMPSPLMGGDGNREFLVGARRD